MLFYFDYIPELLYTMASSSNHNQISYAELVSHRFLKNNNSYELTFDEIGFVGCSLSVHCKRQHYSTICVISCEYISKNQIFRKLFNGENADFSKGTIIHHCHKVSDNCIQTFKKEIEQL